MITYRNMWHDGRQRFAGQISQYVGTRLYAETNRFSYALSDWVGSRVFIGMPAWSTRERIMAYMLPTIQLDDMGKPSRRARALSLLGIRHFSSMQALYQHPQDNINLYGYLTDHYSLHLYSENRRRIRAWFTWKPEIDSAFRAATRGMSWVGLHVRRGDFAKPGRIIPVQTHLDALVRVRGNLPVYLASDDPMVRHELNREMLLDIKNPLSALYAHTPGDFFDFWMLQHAAVVVAGGSSFSWWAAFLGHNNALYAPPLSHLWGKRHIAPPPIVHQQL